MSEKMVSWTEEEIRRYLEEERIEGTDKQGKSGVFSGTEGGMVTLKKPTEQPKPPITVPDLDPIERLKKVLHE